MASTTTEPTVEPTSTEIAEIEEPKTPEVDQALLKRLNTLTEQAKKALQTSVKKDVEAWDALYTAADRLRTIRDENLVTECHIVDAETKEPLTFESYVEQQFGKSRDAADKYVRAANVIDRLKLELDEGQIEQYGLPTSEGQARPLGYALEKDPTGEAKLTASIWIDAHVVAENEAADKRAKGKFVPPTVVVTKANVEAARERIDPKPVKPKPRPKKLPADATPLQKALYDLKKTTYKDDHFDTFIDLVAEGVKIAVKFGVTDAKALKAEFEIVRKTLKP